MGDGQRTGKAHRFAMRILSKRGLRGSSACFVEATAAMERERNERSAPSVRATTSCRAQKSPSGRPHRLTRSAFQCDLQASPLLPPSLHPAPTSLRARLAVPTDAVGASARSASPARPACVRASSRPARRCRKILGLGCCFDKECIWGMFCAKGLWRKEGRGPAPTNDPVGKPPRPRLPRRLDFYVRKWLACSTN